ncbi:gephyrin-like molybdotransferase Glp [Natranaerofaba carboxydovora]|uniref:molybdopterin molybdotransferase MoeA n=1 Tax=Natranaerofaba carboxydovora TaxID=2742683 RepID=UPI001F134309|nr:gephyrin-like molybdotransferase Glp [Natranaerofaba carboxydovora]UMZ74555.1 Molybdopterin molybdenumtransferase [Natranaerofaba carboxydovora]
MLEVLTVDEAINEIIYTLKSVGYYNDKQLNEVISTEESLNRIVYKDIHSSLDLPPFSRSTVDGYAVRADETYGVSESFPGVFTLAGKVLMGEASEVQVKKEEVVEIATGGMLPQGTDSVVMIEETEALGEDSILINKPISPGENVIKVGEDVKKGQKVLEGGHKIRTQDLGALAALGITEVEVYKKPKVGIISTGDEIIGPSEELTPGKIRDINSWALSAEVLEAGAKPINYGICPDNKDKVEEYISKALEENDLVIVSGGSSVGEKDVTSDVINLIGDPGVIFHGISIKPGKPTIFGMVDDKPIFGLSGNPVSAMVTFRLFVKKAIDIISGKKDSPPVPTIRGKLTRNLSSRGGREDYVRVKLQENENGNYNVIPVLGESGLIFTLVEAEGLLKIPRNTEGLRSGEEVEVYLL